MADEQDWAAYANQDFLENGSTLLKRTPAGAGAEVGVTALFARRAANGNLQADGKCEIVGQSRDWWQLRMTSGQPNAEMFAGTINEFSGAYLFNNGYYTSNGEYRVGNVDWSGMQLKRSRIDFCADTGLTVGSDVIPTPRATLTTLSFGPSSPSGLTLGTEARPWGGSFFSSSSTILSDARAKKWLRYGLSDAEYAAGLEIREIFGWYQHLDAIALKGEDHAREHYGVKVQQLWDIFARHGLSPERQDDGSQETSPVAIMAHGVWDDITEPVMEENKVTVDQDVPNPDFDPAKAVSKSNPASITVEVDSIEFVDTGDVDIVTPAGDKFMLRLDMLGAFMGSVRDRKQDDLEARIAALEAVE